MPIIVVNYNFWSAPELEYQCDKCGAYIQENYVVEDGDYIYCPRCFNESEK